MGIFDAIKSAIFGSASATEAAESPRANAPPQTGAPPAAPLSSSPEPERSATPGPSPAPATSTAAPAEPVDVEAVLSALAARNPQKLDWRRSVVDLMKLLDLDSSLSARRELAQELNYKGDTNDTAAMNVWLRIQVMNKLAASGGKVPDDLRT